MFGISTSLQPLFHQGRNAVQDSDALSEAIKSGDLDESYRLILGGAQMDFAGDESVSLLLKAAGSNRLDIVQLLLEKGVRIDRKAVAPIFQAICSGRSDIVRMLIAANRTIVHAVHESTGMTTLQFAVKCNQSDIIQILLEAGVDVNAYDCYGYTPIHQAYAYRLFSVITLLLEHGAKWYIPHGHEASEMRFLAAAWGIGGKANIHGRMISREGASGRKPELWTIGSALQAMIPEIAGAFMNSASAPAEHLDKIRRGELAAIVTGWVTHSIILILYRGYLAICNRGEGGPTKCYKIDPSKVTRVLLNDINEMASKEECIARHFFYKKLPKILAASQKDQVCRILNRSPQKMQRYGFCAYDSSEAALFVALAFKTLEVGRDMQMAKSIYKLYTTYFRFQFLYEYLDQIASGRIQKESVDFDLLLEIRNRLQDPNWHPERFAYFPFDIFREEALTKVENAILSPPLK